MGTELSEPKAGPRHIRGTPLCFDHLEIEAKDPIVRSVVECERPRGHKRGPHHGHTFDARGRWVRVTWEYVEDDKDDRRG